MMMLSDKMSAEEAERIGLIYKAVEEEDFKNFVSELALKLSQMPTKALGMTKRLINAGFNNSLDQQLDMEGRLQIEAGESYDYQEGVNAFLEKRAPEFKGE
jgi:2-(1,2-epoxy-1,2-dihydrophenyl)acetyl-CoA isomerase